MCAAYKVLSLFKIKNYTGAAEELQLLGDLDSEDYMMDTPTGMCITHTLLLHLLKMVFPLIFRYFLVWGWNVLSSMFGCLLFYCLFFAWTIDCCFGKLHTC